MIKEISCFRETGWISLTSIGRVGGIPIEWNKNRVESVASDVGRFSLSVLVHFRGDPHSWMITCVYGPTNSVFLSDFLVELERIQRGHNFLWRIGGDFNEVFYMEDCLKGVRRTRGMELFENFIDRKDLMDIVIPEPRFYMV